MATRSRRVRRWLLLLSAGPVISAAAPVHAAAASWWEPFGLRGQTVSAVRASGETVVARTDRGVFVSTGGGPFQPTGASDVTQPDAVVSGADAWRIGPDGDVLTQPLSPGAQPDPRRWRRDPGSPELGAGAHLLAAPVALSTSGVVVAVARDNTVWRRINGSWARALLLLPAGFPQGVPEVTSLAAFSQPLGGGIESPSVYLGTDGYSVLESSDGGDDWIRAGPGLPASVTALDADSAARSLFAGTSDGVWVHRLQAIPAPPVYRDAALLWRWLGIALISIIAGLAGGVALHLVARRLS
jgi:hypothetical protein